MPDTHIFTDVLNHYFPEPHASLMNGILFGEDLETTTLFKDQLKIVGLIHLVVLSGSNITLLSSIISSLTIGMGKKISLIISILGVIFFVWFVGAEPPIVRAACMAVLASIALIFGRQYLILYGLILSIIFIAIFWPHWLTGISFQLSYAATIGLLLFGRRKQEAGIKPKKEHNPGMVSQLKEYIAEELRISLAAQAFTVPIIFFYFKQISFISPVANIAVAWSIAPLMIFGFITALLGRIHISLGYIPSYICYILLECMVWVVEILSRIPYASIELK